MRNMTNEQKTLLLLKIPYINLFKLQKIYTQEIKLCLISGAHQKNEDIFLGFKKNINLIGGNLEEKKDNINYDKEYNKEYDNNTGNFNIDINDNKYYYRVERYSTGEGTKYEDTQEIKLCLISGAHQKIDNNFIGCKKFKFIDFITIKNKYKGLVDCGSISVDIKNKTATITSLGNDSKCLKSKNNIEFKYGDIMYQIMLHICKKEKIKKNRTNR